MRKTLIFLCAFSIAGCVSAPSSVVYRGMTVETFSPAAGCGTLTLDQDCSQVSGATRKVEIHGINLRVSGGSAGKVVLVMSMPKFIPDEKSLEEGSKAIEALFKKEGVNIISTKVIYGSGKIFGVHYTLDGDGYSYLRRLSVESS
ncbi:hypothetical protein [Microbulbifer taiwanensis]|uniref:Lipoprotein n=1 Tax=Microbulbifer taiwanensis TaxID=986746 RepID=A0ABW1YQM2_9GAMM|nr:hypothetical protein [Microbulbifer taiwanensis]